MQHDTSSAGEAFHMDAGFSARSRKREVEVLNEQLRKINMSLRQQARSGTVYAPGLTYAPACPLPAAQEPQPPAGSLPTNGRPADGSVLASTATAAPPAAMPNIGAMPTSPTASPAAGYGPSTMCFEILPRYWQSMLLSARKSHACIQALGTLMVPQVPSQSTFVAP